MARCAERDGVIGTDGTVEGAVDGAVAGAVDGAVDGGVAFASETTLQARAPTQECSASEPQTARRCFFASWASRSRYSSVSSS